MNTVCGYDVVFGGTFEKLFKNTEFIDYGKQHCFEGKYTK